MGSRNIKIDYNAPLQPGDTEKQTCGCRANNPNICSNNMLPGVCAFVTTDGICRKPSRAWAKQYKKLSK